MNIRIKELFKSDLDPNSNQWWSKDKIDKINYNFSLMRNGGPAGPIGIEGANGEEGEKGHQGVQGPDGPRGPQGTVGPEASGSWKSYDYVTNQRIIYPSVPFNGTVVPAIGASAHTLSTNDLISAYYGVTPTSPISSLRSGSLNIITEAPISSSASANTDSNIDHSQQSSITLLQDRYFAQSYNIGLETDPASFPILRISPSSTADHLNSKFNIKFDRDNIFNFGNVNTNKLGGVSEINNVLNVNSSAGQIIEFKVGETEYRNHSPSLNKLLTSTDTQGTVVWENVYSIFQVFPVGTIIRIPRDTFFSEENFNLLDATTGPGVLINSNVSIRTNFGSGKLTGLYAGWYLCNGETWGDGGLIEYDTPNLNGFEWEISNIPVTSGGISMMISGGSLSSYNGNIIFSGGISTLGPSVSGVGTNVIGHSFDNSMDDISIYDNENTLFAEDKHVIMGEQISIIYLRQYDYEWGTLNENASSSNIQLQYHAMTGDLDLNTVASGSYTNIDIAMQYATTLNPETLQWNADGAPSDGAQLDAYWNDDSNFASGNIRCYLNGQEIADGWLARESGGQGEWGYARKYINGVGISSDDALETEPKECWMMYSESVNGVDGTYFSIGISNNGLLPPVTMTEADVTGFTGWPAGTSLEKVFISNKIDNHPDVVGSSSDFKDYENTSHIWKRNDGNNTIDQLTDGWYRSLPNTLAYPVNFGYGGTLTVSSGLYMAWRKYWSANDNEFKGDVIKSRFVQYSVGDLSLGIGASTACDATSGNDIFYSSDMFEIGENPGSWQVTNLGVFDGLNSPQGSEGRLYSWGSNQIYVRQDAASNTNGGSMSNLGKYPLILVKSDTFIPGTNNSLKIADWTGDSGTSGYTGERYKSIDSNSKATALNATECPGGSSSGITFDWDDGNNNNTLSYFGSGGSGNVYFTLSGISPSQLSASNFSIENPVGTQNTASVSFTPGNYYVSLNISTPMQEDSEILDLDFNYSGTLNQISDITIGISIDPCHVEGTVISMANGTTKLVENLKVGDVLDSFDIKGLSDSGEWRNFKTNAMEFRAPKSSAKIVRIIKGTYKNYQDINNGLTKITNEHPILIKRPDGEIFFKQALYIDTTDMIYVNEKWTRVSSNKTIHETVNTYSIDVENEDVYIADGILCHNVENIEEKIQ